VAPRKDDATGDLDSALGALAKEIDDLWEVAWYSDRSTAALVLGSYVRAYFGRKEGRILPFRMAVQCEGDGRDFPLAVTFSADGRPFRLATPGADWRRDRGSGAQWDILDFSVPDRLPALLEALTSASALAVRIERAGLESGWEVPDRQLAAAKRVLAVWRAVWRAP